MIINFRNNPRGPMDRMHVKLSCEIQVRILAGTNDFFINNHFSNNTKKYIKFIYKMKYRTEFLNRIVRNIPRVAARQARLRKKYILKKCNIPDQVLGQVHFSKFPVVSVKPNENNNVYLSRVLGVQKKLLPVRYLSSGAQNTVYKAIEKKNGDCVAVRVSRIGNRKNDVPQLDFYYSCHIQNLAHNRLSRKNIYNPSLRMKGIRRVKDELAGVQVIDFVGGISFGESFVDSDNTRRDSLVRKFGRTLGVMHHECKLAHGDANHSNFFDLNEENLAVIDLDRCVDLVSLSGREERTLCRNYDLTQAFSTIFSLISRETDVTLLEERLFSHFSKSYLSVFGHVDSSSRIWENIPHWNMKSERDVVDREFERYSRILRVEMTKH